MGKEVFSNHIGSAGELTVLAPIKPGFVPIPEPLTYAARLRIHLRMLSALRRNGLETDRAGVYVGPVDTLRTLQYVRWTLVDNDTKMLLSVNFDRGFEPYIRRIVDIAGPLLDTILCHCEGFTGYASDQGFEGFMSYATKYQVPVDLFAAAAPDISVDDGDYFLEFDKRLRERNHQGELGDWQPGMTMTKPRDKLAHSAKYAGLALLDQGLNIVRTMYENADRFPEWDFRGEESRDDLLYYRLTEKLVPGFWERMVAAYEKKTGDTVDTSHPKWKLLFLQLLMQSSGGSDKAKEPSRADSRTQELLLLHKEPLAWFASPPRKREISDREELPEDHIQRGLLADNVKFDGINNPAKGFKATHACMLLLRVDDASKAGAFLNLMKPLLWPHTVQKSQRIPGNLNFNLSITHNGLKSLGLPEALRRQFPPAFREGMDARAGLLGDTDCNHPNEWNWPLGNWPLNAPEHRIAPSSIDLIVQIEAALPDDVPAFLTFDDQHPLVGNITSLAQTAQANGVTLLGVEPLQRRFGETGHVVGHLGFVDGVSQPSFVPPAGDDTEKAWEKPYIGELLIGHKTRLDTEETYLQRKGLMRNGTFQVIRKTQLNVAQFEQDAKAFDTKATGVDATLVKSKMVGRDALGHNFADGSQGNGFAYDSDPTGAKTPLQCHIRRTNPREGDTPRIVRRGYSYGPYLDDDPSADVDRGLMFIAYNANIAEQFEVIQRWISGGNSTGIASWHGDPLLAPKRPEGTRTFRFTHNQKVVSVDLPARPMGVLQWGIYAFTPSLNGLDILSNLNADEANASSNANDTAFAQPTQAEATKLLLEDSDDENRDKRADIWAGIRKTGARDAGDYGILVGGKDEVEKVLFNPDGAFSVKPYLDRMGQSVGEQYLGVDDPERHHNERQVLESFLGGLSDNAMFNTVSQVANSVIDALPFETQSREDDGHDPKSKSEKPLGARLESEAFINRVIAMLCVEWFGLPGSGHFDIGGPQKAGPHCPRDFVASSFYVFGPHPTEFVQQNAMDRTTKAVDKIEAFLTANESNLGGDFLTKLKADPHLSVSDRKMAEYIAGTCFGFAGPVTGSFRSVLYDWVKSERLWRIQQRYLSIANGGDAAQAHQLLQKEIIRSMAERPIPDLLHRKAVKGTKVGDVTVKPGDKIVFSLRSAIDGGGDAEELLFGGDYAQAKRPMHSCPGKQMGIQTLVACFAAILDRGQLVAEGPLTLRLKTPQQSDAVAV